MATRRYLFYPRLRDSNLDTCLGVSPLFGLLPNRDLEASKDLLQPKEFLELKNGIRTRFAHAVGGTVLLLGLFFTWRNLQVGEANLRSTQATATKSLQISEETLKAAVEERLSARFTQEGSLTRVQST